MEVLYIFAALVFGLALGFTIGKLTGAKQGLQAETENRILKQRLVEEAASAEKLKQDFSNIANAILNESLKNVTTTAQTNLKTVLDPLQAKISEFHTRLEQMAQAQSRESGALQQQLENLTSLNQTLSEEAKRLAEALRGDVKKQGNWGELKLERLLEASGLKKDIEYKLQVALKDEEQNRLQPDAVIYLPDKRHVVVDAKVSLVSYQKLFQENSDKEGALSELVASVRAHIKGLAERDYSKLIGLNSPDFVFLFIPIEGAFLAVLGHAPEIYDEAYRKKVILLGPSTLLAALKLVHHIWRQEEQGKNAQEIARLAASLYDKFSGFVEDMQKIKKSLGDADKAYDEAFSKLASGKSNLIRQVEKFKELGVQPKKQLPVADE